MSDENLFVKLGVPPSPEYSNDLKVFVADASNEQRLIITHHMMKIGFRNVRSARDGQEVLRQLKEDPADICLIGDNLQSVSGFDLFCEMRDRVDLAKRAFVLISRALNKSEIMLHVESGINDFLIRPIVPADISQKVRLAYQNYANPENPELIFEFAKTRFKAKDFDMAYRIYSAVASSSKTGARPHVGLARIELERKSPDKAIAHCATAIERNAFFVHAFSTRAKAYLMKGESDKALADLKHAVDLSPLNVARLEDACEELLNRQLTSECITILGVSIAAGLEHPYITERMGQCHFLNKNYSEATKYFKEAVRLDPENQSFMNSLAICYRDAENYDEAITTYNQIIKRNPEAYQVLFNKALVLILREQTKEAAKTLHRVLKIKPDFEKARQKLQELGMESSEP